MISATCSASGCRSLHSHSDLAEALPLAVASGAPGHLADPPCPARLSGPESSYSAARSTLRGTCVQHTYFVPPNLYLSSGLLALTLDQRQQLVPHRQDSGSRSPSRQHTGQISYKSDTVHPAPIHPRVVPQLFQDRTPARSPALLSGKNAKASRAHPAEPLFQPPYGIAVLPLSIIR